MKNLTLSRLLATAILSVACTSLIAPAVHARERSTTVHGARGGTYQRNVVHSPGYTSASGSATLPNGRKASRSVDTQRTNTGRTTHAQATGFNGNSASYNSTRTTTATGYVREATVTGPKGATATKQVAVSKQNGIVTRTVTTTTPPPKP